MPAPASTPTSTPQRIALTTNFCAECQPNRNKPQIVPEPRERGRTCSGSGRLAGRQSVGPGRGYRGRRVLGRQAVGIFCTLCQQIPLAKCQVLRRCTAAAASEQWSSSSSRCRRCTRKCWGSDGGGGGGGVVAGVAGRCLCGRRPHPEGSRLHVDFRLNRQRVQLVLMRVLQAPTLRFPSPVAGASLSGIKTNANMPHTTAATKTTTTTETQQIVCAFVWRFSFLPSFPSRCEP